MGLLELGRQTPTITPDISIIEAVHLMIRAEVSAVPVTEGGKIVGIFTERDLMTRVVAAGRDPARTPMRDAMTAPVHTVTNDMAVEKAAALMRQHHIRHLVIVDEGGAYTGMIALRYLLYELLGRLEIKVDNLHGHLMSDSPGG